jgi:hypothetical protein
MSDRILTIDLPENAPKDLERTFDERAMRELVIWETIILNFDAAKEGRSLKEMLNILNEFFDDTLWHILDYRIPYSIRRRRRELVDKGDLSDLERQELKSYTALYDRFVAVRAKAMVLLQQRGYDVMHSLEEQ